MYQCKEYTVYVYTQQPKSSLDHLVLRFLDLTHAHTHAHTRARAHTNTHAHTTGRTPERVMISLQRSLITRNTNTNTNDESSCSHWVSNLRFQQSGFYSYDLDRTTAGIHSKYTLHFVQV
jgi:hypothetical protein